MKLAHQHSKTLAGRRDDGNSTPNRISVLVIVISLVVGMALPELSNIMRGLLALLEVAQ